MTQISGRVLDCPDLRLGDAKGQPCKFKIQRDDCQWSLLKNKLIKPQCIDNWAILDFSPLKYPPLLHKNPSFILDLAHQCRILGIQLANNPLFVCESSMSILSNPKLLREKLTAISQSPKDQKVQLLICLMAYQSSGYKTLKLICDTELGIVTQCCLTTHAGNTDNKKKMDQFLANLALKINAKLGGTNVELFDRLPRIGIDGRPFMLIGADVNHPQGWNTTSPSIAAVVASINFPQSNRYAARLRAQSHRVERIIDVGTMCCELVNTFEQRNKMKPERIIYFRDGVSDGQFDMVLNDEVRDLKAAISSKDYSPTITVIVAQKRHHTRLFPKPKSDNNSRNNNVPPGTVVDSGIIAPKLLNFYICTHYGSRGTSKPTHYYVLKDDHGFRSEELHKLIYNLCFTFVRCTKPVSLVTPVYYADLVAYRGRLYYESMKELQSSRSFASSNSSSFESISSASSSASTDHFILPRLHNNVENGMFYI